MTMDVLVTLFTEITITLKNQSFVPVMEAPEYLGPLIHREVLSTKVNKTSLDRVDFSRSHSRL